jgi:hypothetical protein
MVGHLVWQEKGRRLRLGEEELLGLRLLRAEVPGRPGEPRAKKRWDKAVNRLRAQGAGLLLPPEGACALPQGTQVPTLNLWKKFDVELALDILTRSGADRRRAVVGLADRRPTQGLLHRCRLLSTQVRGISLDLEEGEEEITWLLQKEYGLPVFHGGGDVNLIYTPGVNLRGQGVELCTPNPELPDYDLQGVTVPEGVAHLPLLSLLVEEGKVSAKGLHLVYRG